MIVLNLLSSLCRLLASSSLSSSLQILYNVRWAVVLCCCGAWCELDCFHRFALYFIRLSYSFFYYRLLYYLCVYCAVVDNCQYVNVRHNFLVLYSWIVTGGRDTFLLVYRTNLYSEVKNATPFRSSNGGIGALFRLSHSMPIHLTYLPQLLPLMFAYRRWVGSHSPPSARLPAQSSTLNPIPIILFYLMAPVWQRPYRNNERRAHTLHYIYRIAAAWACFYFLQVGITQKYKNTQKNRLQK